MNAAPDRFRAKATKARQAQSRLKALARMEQIARAHADSPFDFRFLPPIKLPRPLLGFDGAAVGYGERPILEGVELTLSPGDLVFGWMPQTSHRDRACVSRSIRHRSQMR